MSHSRYCEGCKQDHGILYICKNYSKDLQSEIEADIKQFRANLIDVTWIEKQKANGISDAAIAIQRIFAGVGAEE